MSRVIEGIILNDKPVGPSSFDVVRKVRKLIGVKRIGHAGTLDPLASGLMALCLGRYTKFAGLLTDDDKVYDACFRLGISTTTDDGEGEIIACHDINHLTPDDVLKGLACFIGEIMQAPPRYSAIKINGERAYKKARADEDFAIAKRVITIFNITDHHIVLPNVMIRIHCSKGTYIRSLARDLGNALGVGAHASSIRRIASGSLRINNALAFSELTTENLLASVIAGKKALSHLPLIAIDEASRAEFGFGRNALKDTSLSSSFAIAMHGDEPVAIMRNKAGKAALARVF